MSKKKELLCPNCGTPLQSIEIVPYLGSNIKYLLCTNCNCVLRMKEDGSIEVTEIQVLAPANAIEDLLVTAIRLNEMKIEN